MDTAHASPLKVGVFTFDLSNRQQLFYQFKLLINFNQLFVFSAGNRLFFLGVWILLLCG